VSNFHNIKYSIESVEGNFVARSTVASFGLDHVTDKDISSYYRKISSQALFDTGLMPLNGTGVLAIRSAGNHTQIAFQHAPQMSYVNWGANEGDRSAVAYYLAQPYRIWIADLLDGNLYGARMFYSPYPVTTPDAPLYHLNLPNTNCKGYRGNGVGWICLYHNEDWSTLSFNMKIQKLIERCSGVETYNDANMSETDGPRFYRQHGKPEYLCDPVLWEKKSAEEGTDWVLDPDLWIPVLVKSLDEQDRHYDDGQPLTFAMALLGKYNSYYGDTEHPKLVNAFARPDIEIPSTKVFNIFKTSYNAASSNADAFNQFNASVEEKQTVSKSAALNSLPLFASMEEAQQDDDESFNCYVCEEPYPEDEARTHNSYKYCENCFDENFIWCENSEEYLHHTDDNLVFIEYDQVYIDASEADLSDCPNCETTHWKTKGSNYVPPIYQYVNEEGNSLSFCASCFPQFANEHFDLSISGFHEHHASCMACSTWVPKDIPQLAHMFPVINSLEVTSWGTDFSVYNIKDIDSHSFFKTVPRYACPTHALDLNWCPSGAWISSKLIEISPWVSPAFTINKGTDKETKVVMKITACSPIVYNSSYENSEEISHPFNSSLYLFRALTAVSLGIAPAFSNYYTLYNLDGTEYSVDPF